MEVGGQVLLDGFLPVLITVGDVPLIAEGHHAFIAQTGDHESFGFVVNASLVVLDHGITDLGLDILDLLALIAFDQENTIIET